ncbi:dolichyl-diphosphooligosaccharide--protein glycosyltransferase subunit 1 [[Candida] jaroonii]|uniref:Dolichyl-diphosphooligosaccharide--protein glycosyltransferase subunit 1 n=1 Tax=[Candida] jaroonii TaxID=467808 RepID=A0ACA9YEP5_9ASCO|nr:dolichyl-diphosphooligosaccharide--protein glycosyltransferase subunit 1 [[Candida] jaroonii]
MIGIISWFLLFLSVQCIDIVKNWENLQYTRSIDLSKSYIKETVDIEAINIDDKPNGEYYFHIPDGLNNYNISLISGTFNEQLAILEFQEISNKLYKFKLPIPIASKSNAKFKIRFIYMDNLLPLPKSIELGDVQSLLIKINQFNFNAYNTKNYELNFEGLTKGQNMDIINDNYEIDENECNFDVPTIEPRIEDKSYKFGPVEDIPPFSIKPMGLLYDHNRPLAKALNLERSIWLPSSDINKFQIEEYYELTNVGANLKSGFSRVDWMKGKYEGMRNHWGYSHLELPTSIENQFDNYYFTDKVGMVTTHRLIKNFLVFEPRFPLFGGWFYNFTLGWDQNFGESLKKLDDDTYILRIPLINSGIDLTYKNVNLNFYLPENSQFINISSPIEFKSITYDNEKSYLDVSEGHNKITVNYENLFEDLSKVDVLIMYKFTKASYWWKVLKISSFIFTGLISYYLLNLINLKID